MFHIKTVKRKDLFNVFKNKHNKYLKTIDQCYPLLTVSSKNMYSNVIKQKVFATNDIGFILCSRIIIVARVNK